MKPIILGLAGPELTSAEAAAFRAIDPAGYILFARNVVDRDQLCALTAALRDLSGNAHLPILIDQEGGRVARMTPPVWPAFPAGAAFAGLYGIAPFSAMEAMRANGEALGLMLRDCGVTVNCAPVLDIRHRDTHDAIGDRALGADAAQVAALGRAMLDGMAAAGVVGVVKHMPGQGRAAADSHHGLPVVTARAAELEADIAAFAALSSARMGMTGHVMFPAWDAAHCATHSATIIDTIIRGRIGFDGVLMSDDLYMDALSGSIAERAAAAIAAGCDLALCCHAGPDEAHQVAATLPDISAASTARLARAMEPTAATEAKSVDKMVKLIAKRDQLLAYHV